MARSALRRALAASGDWGRSGVHAPRTRHRRGEECWRMNKDTTAHPEEGAGRSGRDPLQAVAELGRIVFGETPLEEVFSRVAAVAAEAIPGADAVSVTVLRGEHPQTLAFTADVAKDLDESQYTAGEGPSLAAARTGQDCLVTDLHIDERWPAYSKGAVAVGVFSSLSMALPLGDDSRGSLNIYSRHRDGLDEDSRKIAEHVAGYAAVVMTNASSNATARLAEQMKDAMASRAVIEQAKGIIMGERRCSAEEAFALLKHLSMVANRKLRDVAAAAVAHSASND